jgi:hypothetical protein
LTKKNWQVVITDGYDKKSDICTGAYKKYC